MDIKLSAPFSVLIAIFAVSSAQAVIKGNIKSINANYIPPFYERSGTGKLFREIVDDESYTILAEITSTDGNMHIISADIDVTDPLWGDVQGPQCGNFNGTDFLYPSTMSEVGLHIMERQTPNFCVWFPTGHLPATGGFAKIRLIDITNKKIPVPLGEFQKCELGFPGYPGTCLPAFGSFPTLSLPQGDPKRSEPGFPGHPGACLPAFGSFPTLSLPQGDPKRSELGFPGHPGACDPANNFGITPGRFLTLPKIQKPKDTRVKRRPAKKPPKKSEPRDLPPPPDSKPRQDDEAPIEERPLDLMRPFLPLF